MEKRVQQELEKEPQHEEIRLLQQQHLMQEWARVAAGRELWEETGVDIRNNLELLIPLPPIYGKRVSAFYFLLQLPADRANSSLITSHAVSGGPYAILGPLGGGAPSMLLRIDQREHDGFLLQQDLRKAAESVQHHSGGRSTQAVLKLLELLEGANETTVS
ncbi:vacuolar protein sorting-associating protein [Cyclospora cayetanensis]|nr:vacuolar protein sorting-associating protein [Cyclospora cayetanensis]